MDEAGETKDRRESEGNRRGGESTGWGESAGEGDAKWKGGRKGSYARLDRLWGSTERAGEEGKKIGWRVHLERWYTSALEHKYQMLVIFLTLSQSQEFC